MSHQSGINVSAPLASLFANAVSNEGIRLVKIVIEDETLVEKGTLQVSGSFEQDFPRILDFLEDKNPAYIAYRLDQKTAIGYDWIFMCYVPDFAKVRDKMLYASTRSTLKKALGDSHFVDDMYGTDKKDFSWEGYQKHRSSVNAAPVLTAREEELARMRKEESGADVGVTTKKAHVHGVFFPMTDNARSQMTNFINHAVNYVQLKIDTSGELVDLVLARTLDVKEIVNVTPADEPRYHFFRFRHNFEDDTLESVVYIYSCPMKSKVKERMLYSSCKSAVMQTATEELGLVIDKNSEVSDPTEITETFVYEELHPKKPDEKKAFKKPPRAAALNKRS